MALSVQRRKVWLTPTTRVPCSNAAKTGNSLKFTGVPQIRQQILAASRPKFTCILSGYVEEVLLFNKFFPLSIHALVAKISSGKVVRWCPDGAFFGDFLGPAFPASHMQHISDMHSKLIRTRATPCVEVWQTSNLQSGQKYNVRTYYIGRP